MKNILLIGGAGYIGTVISSHLLKNNCKVTVLDNFIYGNQFAVQPYIGDPDYRFILGDINDENSLLEASNGVTDVVLLAGLVGDPITKTYPEESELINEKGIRKCIDFFSNRNIDKLIFISTCSNYGLIGFDQLADEEFELNPLSLYAKAKVKNEQYLLSRKNKVDYTGVILRFATAFGLSPRMRFDLTVSEFVRDIFVSKELLVYDENTWRPYCHVRDFARLVQMLINTENSQVYFEIFNVGGDVNNYTKKMIVNDIIEYIPFGKIKYGTNGSDPRNYRVSFSKVKEILGFEPEVAVKEGISELIEALKLGMYGDSLNKINKYGNYVIKYPSELGL